jgi:hypothetical protein
MDNKILFTNFAKSAKVILSIITMIIPIFSLCASSDEEGLASPTLVNIAQCFPQVAINIKKKLLEKKTKDKIFELENIQEELQRIFVLKNKVEGQRYIEFRSKEGIKYSARLTPLTTTPLKKTKSSKDWPSSVEMFKYLAEDKIVNIELSLEQRSLKYDQFIESLLEGVSITKDEITESFVAYPGGLFKRSKLNGKLIDFELSDSAEAGTVTSKKEKVLNCKALSNGYPLCVCKI